MLKNWYLIRRLRQDQVLGQLRQVSLVRGSSRLPRMAPNGPTCEPPPQLQSLKTPILNLSRQAEKGPANFAPKVIDVIHPQKKMMRIQIPMVSVSTTGEVGNHQPIPRDRPLVPPPTLLLINVSRLSRVHPSCSPVEPLVIVTQLQGQVRVQVRARARDASQYLAQLDLHWRGQLGPRW
jgi:hypothetical protein